jgi:tetratricopeptide (TPR) repeat protein
MVSSNRFQLIILCFLLFGKETCYAQRQEKFFLTEEIKNIENTLKGSGLSPAKRQETLIRQARLFQLIGNLEEAAESWNKAAFAEPGKQHDAALLEEAFCFLGLGEMEKSETAAKAVMLTAKDSAIQHRAKYLLAQIEAFRSEDLAPLIELISDPNYEPYRPVIYYTLWKFSGTDRYKTRLLSEYPLSPEARIVKEAASAKAGVMIFPSALWLFFPGRHEINLETSEENSAPSSGRQNPTALQTGLFGKEENAKSMVDRLKSVGFEAVMSRRTADDGGAYWVVTVPSGTDINRTISLLRDKGFESFPVF